MLYLVRKKPAQTEYVAHTIAYITGIHPYMGEAGKDTGRERREGKEQKKKKRF
jgi:hypothetical protein